MATNSITQEDLDIFRMELKNELIAEIRQIISTPQNKPYTEILGKRFLKSYQVQKILGVSPGTLQNLRVNGTLPFAKVGGTILFAYEDIMKVIEQNKFNATLIP
jgi:excisionase family DNA binding protein